MICTSGKPRAGWCVSIQADHSVARVVDKMAVQYFRVGEIRRDVNINTIGLPILVTTAPNADPPNAVLLVLHLELLLSIWCSVKSDLSETVG